MGRSHTVATGCVRGSPPFDPFLKELIICSTRLGSEAALHVELRDEPRAPLMGLVRGESRLLIGSALLRLDVLASAAQQDAHGAVTAEVNVRLLGAEEIEDEEAEPTAGLLRLALTLSPPTPEPPPPQVGPRGGTTSMH